MHKFSSAAVIVGVFALGGPALAEPCTIDMIATPSNLKMLAGIAVALSGLTVTASMFVVRKGLWRYLGVHATDRLRRFGSVGVLLASLGIAGAAWSGDDGRIVGVLVGHRVGPQDRIDGAGADDTAFVEHHGAEAGRIGARDGSDLGRVVPVGDGSAFAMQAQRIDMGRSASRPVSAAITPAAPATAAQ